MPWTQFHVANVEKAFARLTELRVELSVEPDSFGEVR